MDTQPPKDFHLNAYPHANPEEWYNNPEVTIQWLRPELENSGIAEYRYTLTDSKVPLDGSEAEQNELIQSWTPCETPERQTNSVRYSIGSVPSSGVFPFGGSGIRYFTAVAIDTAGNLQFDEVAIRFDRVNPSISNIPLSQNPGAYGPLSLLSSTDSRMIDVSWGTVSDGEAGSGIARVETKLVRLTSEGKEDPSFVSAPRVFSPDTHGTVYNGLEDGGYLIELKVIDKAGNGMSVSSVAVIGAFTIPEDVSNTFSRIVNGFQMTGTVVTRYYPELSEEFRSGEIVLMDTFPLSELDQESVWRRVTRLAADEIGVLPDRSLRLSFDETRLFRFYVGGFSFEGTGLVFDESNGFSFTRVVLQAEVLDDDAGGVSVERSFIYGTQNAPVSLSFPPRFEVDSCVFREEEQGHAVAVETTVSDGGGTIVPSWILANVTRTSLSGRYWELAQADIRNENLVLVDSGTREIRRNGYIFPERFWTPTGRFSPRR